MIREDIFETPIWKGPLKLNNKLLIKLLEVCEVTNYMGSASSVDGSTQTNNLLKFKAFSYTKLCIENYFQQETNHQVTMKNAWICRNPPNSRNKLHVHDCHISGVYYIQTHKDSGNLIFRNPNEVVQVASGNLYQKDKCFWHEYTIAVEENMIVFFPNWVPHESARNQSKNHRLALAFNLMYY